MSDTYAKNRLQSLGLSSHIRVWWGRQGNVKKKEEITLKTTYATCLLVIRKQYLHHPEAKTDKNRPEISKAPEDRILFRKATTLMTAQGGED